MDGKWQAEVKEQDIRWGVVKVVSHYYNGVSKRGHESIRTDI